MELALNALERLGSRDKCRVTLVHRGAAVLGYATEHNRKTGTERLETAGVRVMTDTSVADVSAITSTPGGGADLNASTVDSPDGGKNWRACSVRVVDKDNVESSLRADLFLWTAGATSSNLPRGILNSILPRDSKGRIVTGDLLRAKGYDDVFVLGDCSRARKVPHVATAQVAMQQAPVAAWNVYATLANRASKVLTKSGVEGVGEGGLKKLLPFRYVDLGEMMTLGNNDATVSSLGGLVELSGPAASAIRRLIYAVRMPTASQRLTAVLENTGRGLQSTSSSSKKERKRVGKPIKWK